MPRLAHVLALAAAISSAGATIFIRQGLRGSNAYTGFWINLVVGTVGLWGVVLLTGGMGRVSAAGIAFFVLAGLIGTVAGRLLRYVSIEVVGASISSALINLNPLFAAGLAILLLGERVTVPIMMGTVVIVIGTGLLSIGRQHIGFRPWQITLPLLSALCFGVVAILRKLGLGQMGPVAGSAINITTALIAYTAFLLAAGQKDTMQCRGWSLAHFTIAGVGENGAVFLNVVALSMGAVSVVSPLYGTSPIFVLLFSFFFLRDVETLSGRIIAGTLLIVVGIYLITALPGP